MASDMEKLQGVLTRHTGRMRDVMEDIDLGDLQRTTRVLENANDLVDDIMKLVDDMLERRLEDQDRTRDKYDDRRDRDDYRRDDRRDDRGSRGGRGWDSRRGGR